MNRPLLLARALWDDEDAATFAEYAFMIGLIAIACVAAVRSLGLSLLPSFQHAAGALR